MTFDQAFVCIKNGQYVRRKEWVSNYCYYMRDNRIACTSVRADYYRRASKDKDYVENISTNDILAEDWMVFEHAA